MDDEYARPAGRQLKSGIHAVPPPPDEASDDVRRTQDALIEVWSRMTATFAMERNVGRVHALLFVTGDSLRAEHVSARLGLPVELCDEHLSTLHSWGVAELQGSAYVAEPDPWTWFLLAVRQRSRAELEPMRQHVQRVREMAMVAAQSSNHSTARTTLERIERFARFFEELASLVDTFAALGAAPIARVIKIVSAFVPRRRRAA